MKKIRSALVSLLPREGTVEKLDMDPLVFPRKYPEQADQEVVSLIASSFAFGRVSAIMEALAQVLAPLGPAPAGFLRTSATGELSHLYPDFQYRFVKREGLLAFLRGIREILLHSGGFSPLVTKNDPVETAETIFRQLLEESGNRQALLASNLLADPKRGGPAKRWMLFLRWMVRDKYPDLGNWSRLISPSRLIIPLDTHVLRISRYLGFTRRKTPSMAVAREITAALARFSPDDPLIFDFALAHLGINGTCPAKAESRHCDICPLQEFCSEGRMAEKKKFRTERKAQ